MFITVFSAVHFGILYATLDTHGLDLVKNKIFYQKHYQKPPSRLARAVRTLCFAAE